MFIKLIPYLAALVLVALSYLYVHHLGYVTGKALAQTEIDTFVKQQRDLGIKQQQESAAKEAAAKIANAKALANYQRQLGNSHAYSDYLISRLRPYLDSSRSGVSKGDDRPGSPNPSQAPSDTGIGERIGDALAECRSNNAQLDALIDEITPQL